ncbi:MAG TPA: hypothetical protein VGD98_06085 [Ktedonobacteraceae bacterium]
MDPQSLVVTLPQFAPLSVPMVLHLLNRSANEIIDQPLRENATLYHELQLLEQQIMYARDRIFALFQAEQDRTDNIHNAISVEWFRKNIPLLRNSIPNDSSTLIPKQINKPLSIQTIANWRKSNVLRFKSWGKMDLDSACAVMIVQAIDHRVRHALPTSIAPEEPIWWCYSQAPPTQQGTPAPIIPRPMPFPAQLEPGTLLWAPHWPSFDPEWLQLPGQGALCFVHLTSESLIRWDRSLQSLPLAHLLGSADAAQVMAQLAPSILYKLSIGRIGVDLPSIPFLWPREVIWPPQTVPKD